MYPVLTQPGVHTTDSTNTTIWKAFAKETSKRCAQLLLTRPLSELFETDSLGYNLLHRACLKRDATVVAALLQSGVDANSKTTYGVTAVHLAASVGQTTILHMLFKYGATLDQKENRVSFLFSCLYCPALVELPFIMPLKTTMSFRLHGCYSIHKPVAPILLITTE
ncbi:uncharacterized protein DEA37_0004563 [Paragonimus westermani]|uniref:Uncharacterized protein n=1 Tax=Paragonimus westermani TaxID=34504 RepID=A0A5J4N4D9_9TREM|nr:uncharacterized protein DEA37_0004563 [Paragonimus westermani]